VLGCRLLLAGGRPVKAESVFGRGLRGAAFGRSQGVVEKEHKVLIRRFRRWTQIKKNRALLPLVLGEA